MWTLQVIVVTNEITNKRVGDTLQLFKGGNDFFFPVEESARTWNKQIQNTQD